MNALGKSLQLISWERNARLALRNQWNDGDSGMSTDHWAVDGIWVQSLLKRELLQWSVIAYSSLKNKKWYLQLADESVGTNDIKSSYTENTIGIVHAGLLKYFTGNGDSAVNLLSRIARLIFVSDFQDKKKM